MIQIMGVDPEHWRRGIATQLTQALLERCRSKRIKMVRVMLDQADSEMRVFFERMGFAPHDGLLQDRLTPQG